MIVHFYNGDLAKRKGKINKRFMQDNFENLITHKDMQNMEEGIAASYLAAYLHIDYKQFEVRESPDLALTFDNKMVGVEITTLRPSIYMTFQSFQVVLQVCFFFHVFIPPLIGFL